MNLPPELWVKFRLAEGSAGYKKEPPHRLRGRCGFAASAQPVIFLRFKSGL
jgi:hypothetical protein